MVKYKCNQCGNIVNGKSNIPLEHGKMQLAIFPNKATSKVCNGTFIEIKTKPTLKIEPKEWLSKPIKHPLNHCQDCGKFNQSCECGDVYEDSYHECYCYEVPCIDHDCRCRRCH